MKKIENTWILSEQEIIMLCEHSREAAYSYLSKGLVPAANIANSIAREIADIVNTTRIIEAITNTDYTYYGVRADDVWYNVGDYVPCSRKWVDGDPTQETLDGTSCVGLRFNATPAEVEKAIKTVRKYPGSSVNLIAGHTVEYGEDEGEYIIKTAVVVENLPWVKT